MWSGNRWELVAPTKSPPVHRGQYCSPSLSMLPVTTRCRREDIETSSHAPKTFPSNFRIELRLRNFIFSPFLKLAPPGRQADLARIHSRLNEGRPSRISRIDSLIPVPCEPTVSLGRLVPVPASKLFGAPHTPGRAFLVSRGMAADPASPHAP